MAKETYELLSRGFIQPNIGVCYQTSYCHEKEKTWAEKRRDELLRKLIRKRVFLNDVLLIAVKTVLILLFAAITFLLLDSGLSWLINYTDEIMFGISIILWGYVWVYSIYLASLLISDFVNDKLEITNIKHKNKIYTTWLY